MARAVVRWAAVAAVRQCLSRPLSDILEDVEQRVIGSTLTRNEGNLSKTARELGIDRNTLKRKLPGRRG